MMIRVSNSVPGGCQCKSCGMVDTDEVLRTWVNWEGNEVQETLRCTRCGYRHGVSYPIENKLVFSVEKQAYEVRSIRGEL